MPLSKSDTIGTWIKDFKKSDAPQFRGKSSKERRDMAVAAYLAKKREQKEAVSKAPKIGPDSLKVIRAKDKAMKPAKPKRMTSTQKSLAAIRQKAEGVKEAAQLRSPEDPTRDRRGWRITTKRLNRHLRNTTKDVEKSDKSMGEGYVSMAQQRAVWATRKDGGKGHPDNKKKTKKESVNLDELTGKDSKGHFRATEKGAGMTQKGVDAVNRKTGGNLKTAVTTKPSKLKKDSKAANRRKSYCARSAGQLKMWPKAAKDPNSRLRQARRRWNC